MKLITIIAILFFFNTSGFTQKKVEGKWKISTLKVLQLNENGSFILKKGAYNHEGRYQLEFTEFDSTLVLIFPTTRKIYKIKELTSSNMSLVDSQSNKILNCSLISRISTIKPDRKETSNSKIEPKTNQQIKKHIKKPKYSTPKSYSSSDVNKLKPALNDHLYFLSFNAKGKVNFARGEGAKDTIGVVAEDTYYRLDFSPLYSYSGGMKIGYKLMGKTYMGSGANYSIDGYKVSQSAIYHDPIYQYDATSQQTATYSISTIEVPLWVDVQFYKSWNIELGGYLGIHLSNTSKVNFTAKNDVVINGEADDTKSVSLHKYTETYPNISKKSSYGYFLSIHKYWGQWFSTSLNYQKGGDYSTFGNKSIQNESFSLGINLRLI